jgi:AraC-like DNA-binding protein
MATWPAAMIVWGPGFTSTAHGHHCVQLLMAIRGSLLVRGDPAKPWTRCGAALVRPDAVHEVDARGRTVLIGFIDAESELGAALSAHIDGAIASVPAPQVARWRGALGPTPNEARVERWVSRYLLQRKGAVSINPRVRRVLTHLREHVSDADDVSLKALARVASLSQSRLMHLFTESVGVPLRPCILWLRLLRAARELAEGASVTTAAHSAGFADAAHLSRTFRRMFGMTPSDVAVRKIVTHSVTVPSADALHRGEPETDQRG